MELKRFDGNLGRKIQLKFNSLKSLAFAVAFFILFLPGGGVEGFELTTL